MTSDCAFTTTNSIWNGLSAGTSEGINQFLKNSLHISSRTNIAANIVAYQAFQANVIQAFIDSNKNPTPEMVTQIEKQGVQILTQIAGQALGAEVGAFIMATAIAAVGGTAAVASAPLLAIGAIVGAVAGGGAIRGQATY